MMFGLIFAEQRFDRVDRSGIFVEVDVTTNENLEDEIESGEAAAMLD